MMIIHLIRVIVVILGLFIATKLYFHVKQGKLIPETWVRLLGIGAGAVLFVMLMIGSILQRPLPEIVEETVSNFIWSLAFGIVTYIGGRIIARRVHDKQ